MLNAFADWLGRTPLTSYIENAAWVVPTVQVVHILAITVIMGAVAIVNLRILGIIERGQSIGALTARFLPPSIVALAVLAATGLLMIAGEPTRAMFRYVFWAKMAMIAAVILLTAGLIASLKASAAFADPAARAPAASKALAVVGLLIWAAIIVAGRWIGYAQGWPGSPQ